ncbi:MAG: hypothetical protein EA391_07890 [Balneolaceae bacterium]|nr:MAG: hypothetical protein EA391_07890 [Balneolaceae bacterium]
MNTLTQQNCHYLTPNKTIETISVSNGVKAKTLFIYNYQGISFRVFASKQTLAAFWEGEAEEDQHFETEEELDAFLAHYEL